MKNMKNMKNMIGILFSLVIIISTMTVVAKTASTDVDLNSLYLLDGNTDEISSVLKERPGKDKTITNLTSKFEIKKSNKVFDKDDIIIVSQKKALSESKKVKNYILLGGYTIIYGDDLDISNLEKSLDVNIENLVIDNTKFNGTVTATSEKDIIVFHNVVIETAIQIDIEKEKKKIKPKDDIFIQTIMQYLDDSLNSVETIEYTTRAASSSDSIVKSGYNIKSYCYRPNNSGVQVLRGEINVDWILYKNNNETDLTYDYFYIEDNVEAIAYPNSGCNLYGINVTHALKYSSDNLISWGPVSNNNSSQWSFGLGVPWGITLGFTSGTENIDIKTTGSQINDTVTWQATDSVVVFGDYPMDNPTRIIPVSAWASTGSLAGIQLNNSAVLRYGTETIDLPCNISVIYGY